jgi:hypothetical protein
MTKHGVFLSAASTAEDIRKPLLQKNRAVIPEMNATIPMENCELVYNTLNFTRKLVFLLRKFFALRKIFVRRRGSLVSCVPAIQSAGQRILPFFCENAASPGFYRF